MAKSPFRPMGHSRIVDRNALDCVAARATALPYPKNIYFLLLGSVFMLRDTKPYGRLVCSMITTPSPSNEMLIFTSIFKYTQNIMAHGAWHILRWNEALFTIAHIHTYNFRNMFSAHVQC